MSIGDQTGPDCLRPRRGQPRVPGHGRARRPVLRRRPNTTDFDLVTSRRPCRSPPPAESDWPAGAREPPGWPAAPDDFARYEIGRLHDGGGVAGVLAPQPPACGLRPRARAEVAGMGGEWGFSLSRPDAEQGDRAGRPIGRTSPCWRRSRTRPWHPPRSGRSGRALAVSSTRSRRGFDRALGSTCSPIRARRRGRPRLHAPGLVRLPSPSSAPEPPAGLREPGRPRLARPLRDVPSGAAKHMAVVEVVRRAYKCWAMELDRLDKESRSRQEGR